ncbi:hypothetical protein M758_9G040400 [Ceratodon purpureus]|uniref:Uncharacterized protein n=1 Tax=Ceratodon purpureus TaxID=3225 RepID=A0A8T0GRA7_CERPU|nr:hypothetical protein KC19_9G039600 [Ceratodon purpureus]KAG0605214.1 hypothetical protein M758_9G040400 [Ceratodon purpureus]
MAVNPQLFENGTPVPFVEEIFVLRRDAVDFEADKIAEAPGSKLSGRGTVYLSNYRIVFVLNRPVDGLQAFDLPLVYIHEEKFNQPIFFCNNLAGKVHPVIPEGENRALYAPHFFKISFKEGGTGTFIPLFMNLIKSVRAAQRMAEESQPTAPPAEPLPVASAPVDEMLRHAWIDPSDPSKLYLQQPSESQPTLRRRNYSSAGEAGQM